MSRNDPNIFVSFARLLYRLHDPVLFGFAALTLKFFPANRWPDCHGVETLHHQLTPCKHEVQLAFSAVLFKLSFCEPETSVPFHARAGQVLIVVPSPRNPRINNQSNSCKNADKREKCTVRSTFVDIKNEHFIVADFNYCLGSSEPSSLSDSKVLTKIWHYFDTDVYKDCNNF